MESNQAVGFINGIGDFFENGFGFAAGDVARQPEEQNLLRSLIEKGLSAAGVGAAKPADRVLFPLRGWPVVCIA